LTGAACSDRQKRFWRPRSAAENYRAALEAEHADDRRDAVTRIAESGYVTSDDAFGVLDAVARTDPADQVRCVALRALARYDDERPIGTLLAVLQAGPDAREKALPAGQDVRREAAAALAELHRKNRLPAEDQPTAGALFVQLAERTSPRDLRIIALRALGGFQDRRVFAPLVQALRESDFALADAAERALMALTGRTFDYDPEAWERWLAAAEHPFEHAGEKVVSTRPAGPTWWDRERARWQRAFKRD
jgi:hypothetical protein